MASSQSSYIRDVFFPSFVFHDSEPCKSLKRTWPVFTVCEKTTSYVILRKLFVLFTNTTLNCLNRYISIA